MMMAPLLLATALQSVAPPAGQQLPNLVRLNCRIPDAHGRESFLPLAITLDVQGDHIASVIVAGPQLFSSYQRVPPAERPVRPENLRAERPVRPENLRLLPRDLQWHGNFQGRAIRLRRAGAGMVLEPAHDPGAYAGFWNQVVSSVPYAELHGSIDCRIVSGTLNESARS